MVEFFKPSEFTCKCGRKECDAPAMDMSTVFRLNGLRLEFGEPMHLTSGTRCKYWNAHPTVKGSKGSQHMLGKAVDVACPDHLYMGRLVDLARKHRFEVGIKKGMVHLDTRDGPNGIFGY